LISVQNRRASAISRVTVAVQRDAEISMVGSHHWARSAGAPPAAVDLRPSGWCDRHHRHQPVQHAVRCGSRSCASPERSSARADRARSERYLQNSGAPTASLMRRARPAGGGRGSIDPQALLDPCSTASGSLPLEEKNDAVVLDGLCDALITAAWSRSAGSGRRPRGRERPAQMNPPGRRQAACARIRACNRDPCRDQDCRRAPIAVVAPAAPYRPL
jgi:hypothetical protein